MKTLNTPLKSSTQSEDKQRLTQLKTIFQYLETHIATASMVSNATGVPQKNLTRYKRDLEKNNRLWELKKDVCGFTGFKAWYLTTNPQLKPSTYNQLSLFNDFERGNDD